MIRVLSLSFVFIFCLSTFSQTKDEAIRDAKKTAAATLKSDIKTVLEYTYSPVLEMMGGKEKALTLMTKAMSEMAAQGFKFEKAEVISSSEIVNEQNQYRCFIKNNYIMTFNGQRITSESYLLGIYNEKEKRWSFIEAKQLSNPAISQVFTDFKTSLVIPQGKMSTKKI